MPRVTVQTLAEILRALRPYLGQPNFPYVLYQTLRAQLGRQVAIAADDLHFPDDLPGNPPRLSEAGINVWVPEGQPPALEELVRTLIRAHVTIADLRGELLAIEEQSSRSARMLSVLAHEIKNPLFAVLGSLELLTQKSLDDDVQKLVETAHASAQRMHALVNDSLQLVALEQEGVRLKAERLSINKLLAELASEIEPVALASEVQLRVIPLRGDAELLGDRRWLLQALLNLALNAVKYTPAGGRITLRAFRSEGRTGIVVEDTGHGIAENDIERIFEPFQRADTKKEGSGLGLTIVKRVIEAHGGDIQVDSRPGQGSSFRVELPMLIPGRRGGTAWGLRVLVLTVIAGLLLARMPIFPMDVQASTPAGMVKLTGEQELSQGGMVVLGSARMNFDPGSRVLLSTRRSLLGDALSASLQMRSGGVAVERTGSRPTLKVALRNATLRPRGTEFYAETGASDRVSLYRGALALSGPGFKGELGPGEGVVVSAAGVEKRKLLSAPQVRARTLADGRLELHWLPVEGAVRYRVELSEEGREVVVATTTATRWEYAPMEDRNLEARVRAIDDLGLAGAASKPQPYQERGSYYRGHRAFLKGEYAEAARFLEVAVSSDPALAEAWLEYGLASLELGEVKTAREALERAVQLEPEYEERILLPLARALEQQDDVEAAAEYYARARTKDEWRREGTLGLIRVYLKQEEFVRAEELACDWLLAHPGDAEVKELLQRALSESGREYARPGCPEFQPPPETELEPAPEPPPEPVPENASIPKPKPEPAAPRKPVTPRGCDPFCK